MKVERFEDLETWQAARELTNVVYGLTKQDVATDQGYITGEQFAGAHQSDVRWS